MKLRMFDGAMGTMLQAKGIADKPCPEYACIIDPQAVMDIHSAYIQAGSDIIETNTFGANPIKLAEFALADQTEAINRKAVEIARAAATGKAQVAGSVGPLGQLIAPIGELDFEQAVAAYACQIKALAEAGADYILLETIIDIQEMRAGVLAAKSVCSLPIICQMTFEENARTVTGTDIITAAKTLEAMGASVLGMNCSLGPAQLLPIVQELGKHTKLPISVQANAGMPKLVDGKTVFPLTPQEMATYVPQLVAAGAIYIGGCCGTTPEHISAMKAALDTCQAVERSSCDTNLYLTSRTRFVRIGHEQPTVIIGERINPTGRKVMAAELKEGSLSMVKRDALAQAQAGAQVLDVNMGVAGICQVDLMREAITQLAMLVDTPLCVDSTDPQVIEAGLRYYPGRALINSVSDNPQTKNEIFALAKKYGAAVIILPLSESKLPKTAQERVEIARKLIQEAKEFGLTDRDIMLDALVLTVSTDAQAPSEVLETLRLYKQEFGYPTTMGLSNVSFGLPQREHINMAFYAAALTNGLTSPIINPLLSGLSDMTDAMQVILGKDRQGINYSGKYSQIKPVTNTVPNSAVVDVLQAIRESVLYGEKERCVQLTTQALADGKEPLTIANQALTAGMQDIGEKFSAGQAFLPQVLLSAESMKAAFNILKEQMSSLDIPSAGKVLLATVQGDIHDLGKNIVAALLSNNGFEIIDLGKDVTPQAVVDAAIKHNANIVGLCALMTTTLPAMQTTVELLQAKNLPLGIMVGGAVVTAEYAQSIKADMYAKDAVQAVELAKSWMSK